VEETKETELVFELDSVNTPQRLWTMVAVICWPLIQVITGYVSVRVC
jgi:hypothetical protein